MSKLYPAGIVNARVFPRLELLRGFNPNLPDTLTVSAPPHPDEVNLIKSGMLVRLINGFWKRATDEGSEQVKTKPYVAFYDANDSSVLESGNLVCYDTAGDFAFASSFLDGNHNTFIPGYQLRVSDTAGKAGYYKAVAPVAGTGVGVVGTIMRAPYCAFDDGRTNIVPAPLGTEPSRVIDWTAGWRAPLA